MKETVQNAILRKEESVSSATKTLLQRTTDWQAIQAFLLNRIEQNSLTEAQEKKLERYQFIYNQLVSGKYTETDVVNMLKKTHGIKTAQAYEDLNSTREIFNSVFNFNRDFEIKLQLQINRDLLRKATELCDLKAAAAFEKNRMLLLKLLPEEESTPAELFEGHEYELMFDPTLLGAPVINMKDVVDFINDKRKVKINTDMFPELEIEKPNENTPAL